MISLIKIVNNIDSYSFLYVYTALSMFFFSLYPDVKFTKVRDGRNAS